MRVASYSFSFKGWERKTRDLGFQCQIAAYAALDEKSVYWFLQALENSLVAPYEVAPDLKSSSSGRFGESLKQLVGFAQLKENLEFSVDMLQHSAREHVVSS